MIGDDEWLFCLASITQTKCNHHHPTINTHHSPSYKHFIITQQLTPITQHWYNYLQLDGFTKRDKLYDKCN